MMRKLVLAAAAVASAACAQPAQKADAPIMAGPERTPELVERLQKTTGNTLF